MSVPQREQRTQPAQRELATQGGEERGIAILSETAWTILIKFQRLRSFANVQHSEDLSSVTMSCVTN